VWEGWKAGFLAFRAFHTLSFPMACFGSAFHKITIAARAMLTAQQAPIPDSRARPRMLSTSTLSWGPGMDPRLLYVQ